MRARERFIYVISLIIIAIRVIIVDGEICVNLVGVTFSFISMLLCYGCYL